MRRVLAIYVHFFCWQRLLAWMTAIGIALIAISKLLPPAFGYFSVALGSVFAVGFPIVLAGVAFRELIGNRRFVMVPRFRLFATAGLLLLALTGTGVTLLFIGQLSPDIPMSDPMRSALLAFGAISAFLLVSQWLVSYVLGFIGFLLMPLVILRFTIFDASTLDRILNAAWLVAALALIGWVWMIVAMRRSSLPRSLATRAWGRSTAPDRTAGRGNYQWLPQWGRPTSARGTLMRGMPDGSFNRIALFCMAIVTTPVALWLFLFLLNKPGGNIRQEPLFDAGIFLIWSLFGVTVMVSSVIREWPARLRCLWLRTGGDRKDYWYAMERSLLSDILIVASIATPIALLFGVFSNIAAIYLVLYVAACILTAWFVAYAGFWTRAANRHEIVHALIIVLVVIVWLGSLIVASNNDSPIDLFWVLAILSALTLGIRKLAKERLIHIDWCAVRPARMRRKNI